ncbi:hypothetical protein [Thioclava sp. GXIMD4215]|uniref:hypothetical protein n=1 Tax=Thioclava sp. GXIMD4215 TaxID=3131928 RepID=UPI00324D4ECC
MTESDLLKIAGQYSNHRAVSLKTVGLYAADDGKFFDKLENGKTCTLKRANNLLLWFSDNWPEDLDWPDDIKRPTRATRVARKKDAA